MHVCHARGIDEILTVATVHRPENAHASQPHLCISLIFSQPPTPARREFESPVAATFRALFRVAPWRHRSVSRTLSRVTIYCSRFFSFRKRWWFEKRYTWNKEFIVTLLYSLGNVQLIVRRQLDNYCNISLGRLTLRVCRRRFVFGIKWAYSQRCPLFKVSCTNNQVGLLI